MPCFVKLRLALSAFQRNGIPRSSYSMSTNGDGTRTY
jgi:hypothetical protein